MYRSSFAENLRLLSTYSPSITELARCLAINRSQVNKYLAGTSTPRPALLRQICDHFGFEVHEILMPHADFSELIRVRGVARNNMTYQFDQHVEKLIRTSDSRLLALRGTYFEYYASMSNPGWILCALMAFDVKDGVLYYKRLERVGSPGKKCIRHFSYEGIALMLGDRIFLTDHERELGVELTQTVLYPDYAKQTTRMQGMKLGVSAHRLRIPCAARVYIERTPVSSSVLANLRRCGLYSKNSADIPRYILDAVGNSDSGPDLFLARDYE